MKVYISMPINSANGYDPQTMFHEVESLVNCYFMQPVLPNEEIDPETWAKWLKERSFSEASKMLVESELKNLRKSDAVLAIMPNASIGAAMEICYAKQLGKLVVVVVTQDTLYHPWLWYHADHIVWSEDPFVQGVREACEYLRSTELSELYGEDES